LSQVQAIVHQDVSGDSAAGNGVDRDGLRADGIGGGHVASAAVGGQGGVVDLHGLPDIDERSAVGHGHRERRAGDGVDGAEHAVARGLHQLVEKRAELFHAVGHFTLGGVFDGALAAGGGVFDQLRDFNREAEENRRDLRDVVRRAGAAAQVAAVRVVGAGFASRVDLQGQAHIAAGNLLHVAALLDHGEQNVVALVEQGHFVAHLLELQRDDIRVCLCWHLFFSLGLLRWEGSFWSAAVLPPLLRRKRCTRRIGLARAHIVQSRFVLSQVLTPRKREQDSRTPKSRVNRQIRLCLRLVVCYGYENHSTGLGADAASCGGVAYGEHCKAITSAGHEYSQLGLAGPSQDLVKGSPECKSAQNSLQDARHRLPMLLDARTA
jgi:hypothetical protein